MPTDIKITTEMLIRGMLFFVLSDIVFVPLLVWRIRKEAFQRLRWPLAITAACVWFAIWAWAIGNFWETVYRYVFPAWAQTWVPLIAFVIASAVAISLWTLALRLRGNPVLLFCLMGGIIGPLTHTWAVFRGLMVRPPMLQGASPLAAVIFAFFEYVFYWCTILLIAGIIDWVLMRFKNR
jgi:hypothetical protein